MPLIEPEDKQPDEQLTFRLRPELARELRAYGRYASDSSVSHVVSSALRRLFAADKGFQSFKQEHPNAGESAIRLNGRSRRKSEAKS
ncbi:MAG TPA: hypothetical protein VLJ11_03110 [Bryobacteraceae bacterium]|nr:hypothetical protein [Bryobacteraceae bacterium]